MNDHIWLRIVRVVLCVIFVWALMPKRPVADRAGVVAVLLGILILTEDISS